MISMYGSHFIFLELGLGLTIIFDYLLAFFSLICHLIIFLEFDASFYLRHSDLSSKFKDFHFKGGSTIHRFSLDEIKYFICHYCPFIYYFQCFIEVYLMPLYFIVLIQSFFDIKKFRLFKQSIKLFILLFQLNLSQFYNNLNFHIVRLFYINHRMPSI
jgi:hypothetical protein